MKTADANDIQVGFEPFPAYWVRSHSIASGARGGFKP